MSSINRSIQMMELLARKGPLGVRAVAQQLSLPVGSVHRMLLDLAEEHVVERTPDGGWVLSNRLFEITGLQLDRVEFPRLAHPFCERLAEATGETVNVNALSGFTAVCVDKVRGNEGMQLDWRIGSRGQLYCGGAGKAILAYMSESDQERVLAEPMPAFTPTTLTEPKALRAELGRTRERGYSIDNQEVVMGVFCVAVPILDRLGRPVGAISVTGPTPKAPGPAMRPIVDMLNEACSSVSRRLGYVGDWPPLVREIKAGKRSEEAA
jgi:IclR family acetate operon transcriptional repressor